MSCEVARSPFPEPGQDPFNSHADSGDKLNLSPISEFNSDFSALHCVDPQNLSNAGSPSYNPNTTLAPDFTPDAYPHDFGSTPGSSYFHSIEQSLAPPFMPSPLATHHHLHRRSVSEPPDGSLMHHLPQQDGPIIFHRDGHNLGIPRSNAPPVKKVKQSRVQPYQRSSQRQPPPSQSRYQLRRAYVQSSRVPPTSAPVSMHMGTPPPPPKQMHHHHSTPLDQELQFVSSRVCTPAPEAVDPFLAPSPVSAPHRAVAGMPHAHNVGVPQAGMQERTEPESKSVVIKMGVDELRALITEVVQKAVQGLKAGEKEPEIAVQDDTGDEIVVAGCPSGEVGGPEV